MSFSFWVVNLNGIEGLFSAVSRCYRTAEKVSLRCIIGRFEAIVRDVQLGDSHSQALIMM
jgi:hypothetical protein